MAGLPWVWAYSFRSWLAVVSWRSCFTAVDAATMSAPVKSHAVETSRKTLNIEDLSNGTQPCRFAPRPRGLLHSRRVRAWPFPHHHVIDKSACFPASADACFPLLVRGK